MVRGRWSEEDVGDGSGRERMVALGELDDALELLGLDTPRYATCEELVPEDETVAQSGAGCGASVHGRRRPGARPWVMTMRG